MFPMIVHSRSNNIFAGQRGPGKGTYFQDVSPSFNYKCSWLWHSCNWGADLCQIISTEVRDWSPRGRGGQAKAAAPPPTPPSPWARKCVGTCQQLSSEASWAQWKRRLEGSPYFALCHFVTFQQGLFPSLSINVLTWKMCLLIIIAMV